MEKKENILTSFDIIKNNYTEYRDYIMSSITMMAKIDIQECYNMILFILKENEDKKHLNSFLSEVFRKINACINPELNYASKNIDYSLAEACAFDEFVNYNELFYKYLVLNPYSIDCKLYDYWTYLIYSNRNEDADRIWNVLESLEMTGKEKLSFMENVCYFIEQNKTAPEVNKQLFHKMKNLIESLNVQDKAAANIIIMASNIDL